MENKKKAREEEQELVRSTIGDPQRLGAFLALIDQRDEVLQEYAAKIGKYRRDFALLNADYDAQRRDFEKLVSEYNEQVNTYTTKLRQFPSSIFAKICGFEAYTYYEPEKSKLKYKSVKYKAEE